MSSADGTSFSGRRTFLEEFQLPRAIDPIKFALAREPEILALYEAIKGSDHASKAGANGFARHLRRRTASHNPYSHRRRPNLAKPENIDEAALSKSFTNRRMRRKWKNMRADALQAARWTEAVLSEVGGSERPNRRLETHLWHAKRFLMSKDYWGWTLPEGIPGSGRGSRSILRAAATGALMHDASYWCPLLLEGPMDKIFSCLKRVLDPEISANLLRWVGEGYNDWEAEVWMHTADSYPFGAVSPARILHFSHLNLENGAICAWVHAAAASETFKVLSVVATSDVTLGFADLRRLELRGNASTDVIDRALYRQQPSALTQCLDKVQPGDVFHEVLTDPRLAKPVVLGQSSATLLRPELLECQKNTLNTVLDTTEAFLQPMADVDLSRLRGELRSAMALGFGEKELQEIAPSVGNVCFPASLVRHGGSMPGWSIILPAGWVLPVWQALVFEGCRVLGQREWRWIHTMAGNPCFPCDSPDTLAYRETVQRTLHRKAEHNAARPKSKAVPASKYQPADWEGVLDTFSDAERNQGYFIARSESAMLKGLFGSDAPSGVCAGSAARPVFNALKAGKLQWQPVKQRSIFSDQNGRQRCLVEALLYIVKRGVSVDGARLCFVVNREAEWSSQPLYVGENKKGITAADNCFSERTMILPNDIVTFGYVTSGTPYGSPRTAASMAICSAAAFWKLRGLQYYEPRRDRGMIHAWLQNPSSTALFPIRLELIVEKNCGV